MPCIIAAPASGSGKTLLSLMICSWARCKGKSIQPFKVGPDYLDPQQLSNVAKNQCRNLDLILCNKEWVERSFYEHSTKVDFTLIEGVMGLFDGIGSSSRGSTADVAKLLNLPIILIVNAKGQAASIAALVKGFKDHDRQLNIAGVVLNNVNTDRHKQLLIEALADINVKVVGHLPTKQALYLPSRHLGLSPAHEIKNIELRVKEWGELADNYLDMIFFSKHLKSSKSIATNKRSIRLSNISKIQTTLNVAIANDNAFHFRYPESRECLQNIGINILNWDLINDNPIPKESHALIIPGGYPEQYAEQISQSKRSISSLQKFFGRKPIYAECGGMLILGESIKDIKGEIHPMAKVLPFKSEEGNLSVGYRKMTALKDGLIYSKGDELIGHELHKWVLREIKEGSQKHNKNKDGFSNMLGIDSPWSINGWGINQTKEGWANHLLHASWIHLHWASTEKVLKNWISTLIQFK